MNPDLAMVAFLFISVGNKQRAGETVTEAVESMRPLRHLGLAVMESPLLMWAALELGREAELVEVLEREEFKSPWLRAALAVAVRDFHEAADICGGIGTRPLEAFFRLRAAGALAAEGRRGDADEQLRPALEFYRAVGATRYVREGEALLASV